jgi:glycosyltransferase involved in cell wall biosynthesis
MKGSMTATVLITLDSMKHENTGLHAFGRSLGTEIIRQHGGRFDLSLYTYPQQHGYLGNGASYVSHRSFHKLFFPQRDRFDLVHFADQYCRLSPRRVNARKVMTIHDLNQIHEHGLESAKAQRFLRRMRARIDACDRLVAISRFVADDVVTHFPQARDKISVIYNGTEFADAPPGHRPAYEPDAAFLFTIGMVCPKKNFHVLVPLLRGNSRKLIIAGIVIEEYRQKIMAEAARFGVSERVVITGPVSQHDKAWYYANCEAFVFPSLAEGFGMPPLEAMYHGKPTFLSTCTSLPEIGADAAYYFDSFDPDSMSAVLADGLAHFQRHQRADALRAHASNFTWEKAGAAYLALYQSLAPG